MERPKSQILTTNFVQKEPFSKNLGINEFFQNQKICLIDLHNTMDNGYRIREKNHQTSKVWTFWACQSAAQTKSIYVEKNVAKSIKCTKTENTFTLK